MQRLITAAGALALLAGAPATAQTFFPSLAAYRYCELRQIGVDQRTSIDVAMRESASSSPIVYARGYPFLDRMSVGFERYDAFLAFEKELAAFLAPFVHKAFPLSRQFGNDWHKGIIPYDQKIKGKKATAILPAWEAQ